MKTPFPDRSKDSTPQPSGGEPPLVEPPQVEQQQVELIAGDAPQTESLSDANAVAASTTDSVPAQHSGSDTEKLTPAKTAGTMRCAILWILALTVAACVGVIVVHKKLGPSEWNPMQKTYWKSIRQALPRELLKCQLRELRAALLHRREQRHCELVNIANIYLTMGDTANAEQALLQAAAVESQQDYHGPPDYPPYSSRYYGYNTLVEIYTDRGQWNRAAAMVDKWFKADPPAVRVSYVPRIKTAEEIYRKVGRAGDAETMRQLAERAELNVHWSSSSQSPVGLLQSTATAALKLDESREFDQIFPAACSLLEKGETAAARTYLRFIIGRNVPRADPANIFHGMPDAYDYSVLSQMLLPVTSVMLNDYESAKSQFPQAFAAMNQLTPGIDCAEEKQLLYQEYSKFLHHEGRLSEAKEYEAKASQLKAQLEADEFKPWWTQDK